jgi:hypothetical protein
MAILQLVVYTFLVLDRLILVHIRHNPAIRGVNVLQE